MAQPIWTAGTTGAGDFFNIVMTPTGCAGAYKLSVDHWGLPCVSSTVAVTPEAWNHVAMTFDGSVMQFYVNGVPAGSGTVPMFSYSIGTMDIGGNNVGGSTTRQSFNGLIDEAKQYNWALSNAEIQTVYASSAPASYWPAEASAVDVAGGNNGTFTNGSYATGLN